MKKENLKIHLDIVCPICGNVSTIILDGDMAYNYVQYKNSKKGHIQDYLPMLSADIREILLSGVCVKCQSYVFGE